MGRKAVTEEYERLRDSREHGIFFSTAMGGVLGVQKKLRLVGRGAMSTSCGGVDRGYDGESRLYVRPPHSSYNGAAETRGFVMNWRPPIEAACVTGAMVRRLLEAGFV
jgi:hypothetical protein